MAKIRQRSFEAAQDLGCERGSVRSARHWPIVLSALCGLPLTATLVLGPRPLLVWNASSSSPIGLYALGPAHLRPGETALAWAPVAARRLAALRHYLPYDVPLVKKVSAVAGSHVCARGSLIIVDGWPAATRLKRDPSGRTMPWWSGCRQLRRGELFLLSSGVPDAFDGRYFGVTSADQVIGRAWLIWRR